MVLIDSYSEANFNVDVFLQALHPSSVNPDSAGGQSFTNLSGVYKITSAKFYLSKTGLPTGNGHAVLYAHSGTYGVNSVPTGSPLATSDNFDVSTLTVASQLITFIFTGAEQYEMQADVKYCIAYENPTSGTIGISSHVDMGYDNTSPTHSGNRFKFDNSAWSNYSDDMIFYVYGDLVAPPAEGGGGAGAVVMGTKSLILDLLLEGII